MQVFDLGKANCFGITREKNKNIKFQNNPEPAFRNPAFIDY
jgi:hypothetical protein